ncbi:hypothetical protein E2562_032065 [Oryza meyeriana var. granulata]|uniref:Uncharacterized protein n=1 Tax=Oryza meyeriana var. granulata TaxID=110450 RepID=A0A6G1CK81_9ORYZ|nr:hypothetical protein E2562_032065 [Oryza meyeriana var. granulata]
MAMQRNGERMCLFFDFGGLPVEKLQLSGRLLTEAGMASGGARFALGPLSKWDAELDDGAHTW